MRSSYFRSMHLVGHPASPLVWSSIGTEKGSRASALSKWELLLFDRTTDKSWSANHSTTSVKKTRKSTHDALTAQPLVKHLQ